MPETPTPAPAAPDYDLAALEQRQAALFKALARYQFDYPDTDKADLGLALFYQFETRGSGTHYVEAVLTHEAGGQIASGMVPVDPFGYDLLQERCGVASDLVLGICAPTKTQTPPLPLQQKPVESAGPERRTGTPVDQDTPSPAAVPDLSDYPGCAGDPDPEPAPEPETPLPAPVPAAGAAPDEQEVENLLEQIDVIHGTNPEGVKLLVSMFRDQFRIRSAFARSITTRERADWLAQRIEGLKK